MMNSFTIARIHLCQRYQKTFLGPCARCALWEKKKNLAEEGGGRFFFFSYWKEKWPFINNNKYNTHNNTVDVALQLLLFLNELHLQCQGHPTVWSESVNHGEDASIVQVRVVLIFKTYFCMTKKNNQEDSSNFWQPNIRLVWKRTDLKVITENDTPQTI